MNTSKNKIKSLMLVLFISAATISTASARVCFLPDSTDCGEGDVVGGGDVIIPCKYKTAGEVPLNSAYQEPYKSGMCYYARCKISKSTCEANNGKNKKCCKFDDASNCYYMGDCPKEECPADYIYSAEQAADRKSLLNCSCDPCLTDASKWKCTCPEECSKIEPAGTYTNKCDDSQIPHTAEGVIGSNGQCYTCKDKPVDENCEIKGGCIIDMASIGHNSSSGTIGTGDNTEITYTCYITKAENATEADLQKIYGIMYSDFNCQSSMGQIMSSGYQRVGDVINLSSSPVSGKFTVGELTRLANCQGNTAEYNWDTKIELHNETDHCNFTEEIFTKTCKQLGYINKNNSCSSNDLVKTLVENVIGTDGQCYTCEKAQTCSDYDKTYIETSSIKDNDPEDICPYLYSPVFGYVKNLGNGNTDLKVGEYKFKFGGGDNAEFVDASVEGCTACRWKTCEEIDSDFTNDPDLLNCEQGYAPEIVKADWAVGSDGRCYECVKGTVEVVFEYEREGTENAGHYTECVWNGNNDYNLSWSNQMSFCNRDLYGHGEEYNVGDYHDPSNYYTCNHTSTWIARLSASSDGVAELDTKTWTLPFDMEMVVTYDIPDRNADHCGAGGQENGGNGIKFRWASEAIIQAFPEIFAPRTIRMKFPQGSKVNSSITKEPVDYWDGMTLDHSTIEYYVNGQKISGNSITIDDVSYSFEGD